MKLKSSIVLFAGLMFFCQNGYAHAGHDHGHWSSDLLHILFFASLAASAACIGYACFKLFVRGQKTTEEH